MKIFIQAITLTGLFFSGALAQAQEPKCEDQMIAYRPWVNDLDEAASNYGLIMEHELKSCAVKEKMKLVNDSVTSEAIAIKDVRRLNASKTEIYYSVMKFVNSKFSGTRNCKLVVEQVRATNSAVSSTGEISASMPHYETIVSNPACTPQQD